MIIITLILLAFNSSFALADCHLSEPIVEKIIHSRYPNSEIEIKSKLSDTPDKTFKVVSNVEKEPGKLTVQCKSEDGRIEHEKIDFSAFRNAQISLHKILPNTPLESGDFKNTRVDLTDWRYRGISGLIVQEQVKIENHDSKQTIPEGTVLTTNMIRKRYDAQKGDLVQIMLHSGGLLLKSSGLLDEPAYIGDHVRITTLKNKRQLMGIVMNPHEIKVEL